MKVRIVLGPEYISCQKLRTIGLAVWPVGRSLTDRQTDKQTNRGDQYTLRKSKISQSNKRGWIHNIRPTTLANVNMLMANIDKGIYTTPIRCRLQGKMDASNASFDLLKSQLFQCPPHSMQEQLITVYVKRGEGGFVLKKNYAKFIILKNSR